VDTFPKQPRIVSSKVLLALNSSSSSPCNHPCIRCWADSSKLPKPITKPSKPSVAFDSAAACVVLYFMRWPPDSRFLTTAFSFLHTFSRLPTSATRPGGRKVATTPLGRPMVVAGETSNVRTAAPLDGSIVKILPERFRIRVWFLLAAAVAPCQNICRMVMREALFCCPRKHAAPVPRRC